MENDKAKERDIFSKTLYYEGGSTQEIFDVLLIAWVIRNRVDKKGWMGKSYIQVCLKKWQFSCWNGKTLKQIEAIDMDGSFRWEMCLMVAEYVMRAPDSHNPIPGVLHYYNPMLVAPSWAKKMRMVAPLMKLDHIFLLKK